MTVMPLHLDMEPKASDFLTLLRDLGHLDEPMLEAISNRLVLESQVGKPITLEDLRVLVAQLLFDRESGLRPDARDLLHAEWARLFF